LADLIYVSSSLETPAPYIPAPYSSASLVALVRDFDRNAAVHRTLIREVQQYQPESFYATAIGILKAGADSRGVEFLVGLLISQNLLFRALCDPALDREQALTLARRAVRVDPLVDTALARQLADASIASAGAAGFGLADRLMEILGEISDGTRILPSLMRMLRNANPYLRSKAVLLIGRGSRSVKWVESRLTDADARVRANAVEALWGVDTVEARELLDLAARDGNNRVAGNALLGLYWMGESSPLPELVNMAGHAAAPFRRTAAWAMGETGDPRFSEILGRMLADANGGVRKSAFVAVGHIRAAAAQVSQSGEWRVAGFSGLRDPATGQRRIQVAVVAGAGRVHPGVLPVQFMPSENGQPVWSYRVSEKPVPETMSVVFLLARGGAHNGASWNQGVLRCLNWKRPSDSWCTVPYFSPDDVPLEIHPDPEMPAFTANAELAAAAYRQAPKWADCTLFWNAVGRALLPGSIPAQVKRHLIALAPADVGENRDPSLIAAVHTSRISVQVVSPVPNPALQDFCGRAGGHFHLVEDPAAIEQSISLAYLSLLTRYEIRYQPVCPQAADLKLRVHTPLGWGETTVPFPNTG
jgi:hypothetical protein